MNSPKLGPEQYADQILCGYSSMLNPEYLKRPEYRAAFEKLLKERTAWTQPATEKPSAPVPASGISALMKKGITNYQRRVTIIAAVAIAMLGFISMDHYYPGRDIIANIVNGRINLDGSILPLSWVFGFAILLIAVALALPRRPAKPPNDAV